MTSPSKLDRHWEASAPANIAIIKYMGKLDQKLNKPAHPSLSYTLEHLRTYVTLQIRDSAAEDAWTPLANSAVHPAGLLPIELSEAGRVKFLGFAQLLKSAMGLTGYNFAISSANSFPSDCGLASSASSFAALTLAFAAAARSLVGSAPGTTELSRLSQLGSGSSCRSFFGPWVKWDDPYVTAVELPYIQLFHSVAIVDDEKKSVSSSHAHVRVLTSLLFEGRTRRAGERMSAFMEAMERRRWNAACEISWAEFWDMHALFETSQPSFGYMTSGTLAVLQRVRQLRASADGEGPIVTMDAGANIHFLFRQDQQKLFKSWESKFADIKPSVRWWSSTSRELEI